MNTDDESARRFCVVTLGVVSMLLFPVVLYIGLATWLNAVSFDRWALLAPRAAGAMVLFVSIVSQALTMLIVARSSSPLLWRVPITVVGVGIIGLHCLALTYVIEQWQQWGTSPKFWAGDTRPFHWSLVVSVLAPLVCYLLALSAKQPEPVAHTTKDAAQKHAIALIFGVLCALLVVVMACSALSLPLPVLGGGN